MGNVSHTDAAASSAAAPQAANTADTTNNTETHHDHRWIWFVTGPTACGKTTIAKALAEDLGFTFVEGDNVTILFPVSLSPKPQLSGLDKSVPPQSQC